MAGFQMLMGNANNSEADRWKVLNMTQVQVT